MKTSEKVFLSVVILALLTALFLDCGTKRDFACIQREDGRVIPFDPNGPTGQAVMKEIIEAGK